MKRRAPRDAFERLTSADALWSAWHRARREKRRTGPAATFEVDAERHIFALSRELKSERYRPRPYRVHVIRDPKVRAIVLAAFSDRVVHQSIYHVVAPWFERSYIENTFACIRGRGTHRAVLRYLRESRRHRYRLSLDVVRFFPSVDHDILLGLLFERIDEPRLRSLLARIVRSASGLYRRPSLVRAVPALADPPIPDGVGLAIGTLVSQWCANLYLSGLDHHILRGLLVPSYQRYMDDLVLFSNSRAELEEAGEAIRAWAWSERRLALHPASVVEAAAPSDYLGFRVNRAGLTMGRKARERLRANLRAAEARGPEAVRATLLAYRGIALFG